VVFGGNALARDLQNVQNVQEAIRPAGWLAVPDNQRLATDPVPAFPPVPA